MQGIFKNLSIKWKLVTITMLASGVVLVLGGLGIIIESNFTLEKAMVRDLSVLAQVIGTNSTAALVFKDPDSAEKTLSALSVKSHIIAAAIYTEEGEIFATYLRQPFSGRVPPPLSKKSGYQFKKDSFELFEPIWLEGEKVGAVFILTDLKEISANLERNILIVIGGLLVSIFMVFILSTFFQRVISRPIEVLAKTARHVTSKQDYSIRVKKQALDEIGLLFDAFNEMITQIQFRDRALQKSHDELEQRVRERTAELELSNKDLEAFSFSASHDLRAPLRAVTGFTQILQEDQETKLGEAGRRAMDVILKNTKKMGELIDDLLAFSRLGKQELRMVPVNMTTLTKSVLEEIKVQNPDRTVDVTIQSLPDAKGDPSLLKQVLTNLLSNSFKYSRLVANPKIEIASYSDKGETIYFVKDNGAGFDMKYKHKLFGVFQRLHGQKEFEGNGVGLAIVQRIIQRHGGRVWGEGKVNEGATFYFTLSRPDA